MIKIHNLSQLITKENELIRERQDERKEIERDVSLKRSEILQLQEAEREIKQATSEMKKNLQLAEDMLQSLLRKVKKISSNSQNETKKTQEYLEQLQKKVEQATEYFAKAREVQMTIKDMEILREKLTEQTREMQEDMHKWNQEWNTKENQIKARENTVKNAEIIIQYDRDQIEKVKFQNDETINRLRKWEHDLRYRENEVEQAKKSLIVNQ